MFPSASLALCRFDTINCVYVAATFADCFSFLAVAIAVPLLAGGEVLGLGRHVRRVSGVLLLSGVLHSAFAAGLGSMTLGRVWFDWRWLSQAGMAIVGLTTIELGPSGRRRVLVMLLLAGVSMLHSAIFWYGGAVLGWYNSGLMGAAPRSGYPISAMAILAIAAISFFGSLAWEMMRSSHAET